jgi:hypothetical protein
MALAIKAEPLRSVPLFRGDLSITRMRVIGRDAQDQGIRSPLRDRGPHPSVSQVLPLASAVEAHRILERWHAHGKIIIDVTR